MYLSPSKILYTHRLDPDICSTTEKTFGEVTKTVQHGTVFPKLQVVKKDGFYFTLNDAKLQVYRHLEKLGKCGSVEVEKVSLKEVPEGIKKLMQAPIKVRRCRDSKSKGKERGKYHSVSISSAVDSADDNAPVILRCDDDTDDVDSDDDESTDCEDTDSDFSDWSDEEVTATDIETDDKSADENNDDDDENGAHLDENQSFI